MLGCKVVGKLGVAVAATAAIISLLRVDDDCPCFSTTTSANNDRVVCRQGLWECTHSPSGSNYDNEVHFGTGGNDGLARNCAGKMTLKRVLEQTGAVGNDL